MYLKLFLMTTLVTFGLMYLDYSVGPTVFHLILSLAGLFELPDVSKV